MTVLDLVPGLDRLVRLPERAMEFANLLLTTDDAVIGATPRTVVWTHRGITLYRYRSAEPVHPVPILLVFALINRPEIFDLRPGSSFVEYLLGEGFDVFLVDWGYPGEEDADMGFEEYVCDELHWAIRETLRASGQDELTLLGWCMGATMCSMYCGLPEQGGGAVRNLVLLTTPVDGRTSVYARWVNVPGFDAERIADDWRVLPGGTIDFANKLVKPVTNFLSSNRRIAWSVLGGEGYSRESYQAMARWIGDNPEFPGRAWSQWIRWLYQDDALVSGRVRLRGSQVDLRRIDQNLLVVTAAADHIAPRAGTVPLLDLVASADVTHFDRPGGHIGLIAGSGAKREIWPDLADWIAARSDR
jgi:polyhydroxyalkanoate synthase